jgi:hypothetical protein
MITFDLDVEDLADTRFAMSPVAEGVHSLWALREPGRFPLHLPWLRSIRPEVSAMDLRLLRSMVGPTLAIPDFLTPRPTSFAPDFEDELATVLATPPDVVRRDLVASYAPAELPEEIADAVADDAGSDRLLAEIGSQLRRYWEAAIAPTWGPIRLLLEADMTYRARQLAIGGARLLFADLHPNVRWRDGTLSIDKMIGKHAVTVAQRGLLLIPSVFAYKPVPPLIPYETPSLSYPCRGVATLWAPTPSTDPAALGALIGAPRARLLGLLAEPLATIEIARRLRVTPSAVSQHLKVLRAAGLVTRARAGRQVLYARSPLGEQLLGER